MKPACKECWDPVDDERKELCDYCDGSRTVDKRYRLTALGLFVLAGIVEVMRRIYA